jgi:hypothetical protein
MGSTIWIEVFNRPLKETANDCSKPHYLIDQLDCLAVDLGIAKLSNFYDWTEMALAADAETRAIEAIEPGEKLEPSFRNLTGQSLAERQSIGEWFEPTMALTTVRTLKEHIARHPTELELDTDPDDVARYRSELLDELNLFDQILQRVLSEGQRFRFLIVP